MPKNTASTGIKYNNTNLLSLFTNISLKECNQSLLNKSLPLNIAKW